MRRSGFTLIELIVSIAILLLLSSLFIANYNGFNSAQVVRQSRADFMTNLQAVRTNAADGVKPAGCDTLIGYIVKFPSAATYTAQALCESGEIEDIHTYTLPSGVTFSPAPTAITFYALNRGASADQTITLTGSGVTMQASVSASGVISEYAGAATP